MGMYRFGCQVRVCVVYTTCAHALHTQFSFVTVESCNCAHEASHVHNMRTIIIIIIFKILKNNNLYNNKVKKEE